MQHFASSIHGSRASPSTNARLEDDPEPMVQQQLARLKYFEGTIKGQTNAILEFGCGFGFNCDYLRQVPSVSRVAGFDLHPKVIALTASRYPENDFYVGDACSSSLSTTPGQWDYVVAFEVLEHVPDMDSFLSNVYRHLRVGGTAFISTPNRQVFSLGHEPSPINQEHVKELDPAEFHDLLQRYFQNVRMVGQRFTRRSLLETWQADARTKIARLNDGTRWTQGTSLRARLRRIRLVDMAYQVPALRLAWKWLRWGVFGRFETWSAIRKRKYTHADCEFVENDFTESLWLCATVIK